MNGDPISLMGVALDLKDKAEQKPLCRDYYPEQDKQVETILEQAQAIVQGQRRDDYGDARECFNRIAKMWSGYLGIDVTAFDVANLMITLKLCRAHGKGFQKDLYTDIAGYSYCAEIIYNQSLSE